MSTITLRATKGLPLTVTEVDSNFSNLNSDKMEKTSNLSDLTNTTTARTNLGVAIGTNVQAWDADLDSIAGLAGTTGLLKKTAANTWVLDTTAYGTITSVSGTAPVVSSGGTAPTISMAAATSLVNGYMTSTYASKLDGIAANATNVTNTNQITNGSGYITMSSIGDGTLSVTAGTDLAGGGVVGTANQSLNSSVSISHGSVTRTNTTSTLSVAVGGTIVAVDGVTTSTTGHITGVNTRTFTLPNDTLQTIADDVANNEKFVTFVTSAAGAQTGSSSVGLKYNPSTQTLTVGGNLIVNGTTTTINSTTISVDDKNIELGSIALPTDATADGGGITLKGASDKTFNWVSSTGAWTSSEHFATAAGKNILVSGATSGTATIAAPAAAGTPTLTLPTATGTFALLSNIGDGTMTVTAGSGLTGGGALGSANQTGASSVTLSHSDTSSVADLTAATNTFIAGETYDTYGHVQTRTTGTVDFTVASNYAFQNVSIGADSGYTWGGANTNTIQAADSSSDTLTLVAGGGINLYTNTVAGTDAVRIEHADTSTAANLTAASRTYVTSLTFDTYGHVTGYGTGSETVVNTDTIYSVKASVQTGGAGLDLDAGGSGSGTDTVVFKGSGAASVAYTDANTITFSSVDTTYTASTGLTLTGTAFSVNYGTTLSTACQGNDSRLSDARVASDVYVWAKAPTKPSYNISEMGVGRVTASTGSGASGGFGFDSDTGMMSTGDGNLKFYTNNVYAGGPVTGTQNWDINITGNAGNADTVDGQHFSYTNVENNPTYVWGTNSSGTNFLAARGSMSVNYANSAGSANSLNASNSYALIGLTVGNGQANSSITMYDSDEGSRTIHCNSNNVGFLTQAGNWGAWCDDGGNWTATGNVTAYSDARLKTDLQVIPTAVDKVQQLTGYTYTRTDSGKRQTGIIAQDLIKVLPEAVDDSGEYLSVAYGNVVGLLVEAIKELKAEIEELKKTR